MGSLFNLSTEEFADLVADAGEAPFEYRVLIGPCPRTNDPLQGFVTPDPDCPLCGGTGTIYQTWTAPSDSITGGVIAHQNAQLGKTKSPIPLQEGDLIATFLSTDFPMRGGDLLLFASRTETHAEELVRGSGATDRLQFRAAELLQVYVPTGQVTSGCSIADDPGELAWDPDDDQTPAVGTNYLVQYRYYLPLVVQRRSHYLRRLATNGDPFPNRVVLRAWQRADTDTTPDLL